MYLKKLFEVNLLRSKGYFQIILKIVRRFQQIIVPSYVANIDLTHGKNLLDQNYWRIFERLEAIRVKSEVALCKNIIIVEMGLSKQCF